MAARCSSDTLLGQLKNGLSDAHELQPSGPFEGCSSLVTLDSAVYENILAMISGTPSHLLIRSTTDSFLHLSR